MNDKFNIQKIGSNVRLKVPLSEPGLTKIPVYCSKTDGTMYPLSQAKTIECTDNGDKYIINWDRATATLTKRTFDIHIRPYIEIVNQ